MSEVITREDVEYLMALHCYCLPGNPVTAKALALVPELQVWLNSDDIGAWVYISEYTLEVLIGEDIVWWSEDHGEDDLTLDFCKEQYRKLLRERAKVFDATGGL